MKIGIIGSGEVGISLGEALVELGYQVMIGSREPSKKALKSWTKKHKKLAQTGSTTEAAEFGELAILALAWHATEDVMAQIRPELAGKIVIDVTNPLLFSEDDAPQLSVGHNMSGGELVQQSLPDSHVVKTLNIINHAHMSSPKFKEGTPAMFVCGNNDSAKNHAMNLLEELGWKDITDLGGIRKSRLLEPLCLLWVEYGVAHDTWDHAFAVLKK